MNRTVITILFLFSQFYLSAQPAPCTGQSIIVIGGIIDASENDTAKVTIGDIRYIDPRYPKMMGRQPIWSDCISEDSLLSNNLYLYPSNYYGCNSHTVKSESSPRYYLVGHPNTGGVLTIEVGAQKMFIVLPDLHRSYSNGAFTSIAFKHLTQVNYKNDEKHFYSPILYLPSIEFKAGVFFLKDYSTAHSFKKFSSSEISEFHRLTGSQEVSPEVYWNKEISFYAPYETELQYSQQYEDTLSENEAIEIIVKNSSHYIRSIIDHNHWKKYTKDKTLGEGDIELKKLLFEMRGLHEKEMENLFTQMNSEGISEEEFLIKYDSLKEQHLPFILENDFDLTLSFNKYLLEDKDSIDDFKNMIQQSEHKLSKDLLHNFFEQKSDTNK